MERYATHGYKNRSVLGWLLGLALVSLLTSAASARADVRIRPMLVTHEASAGMPSQIHLELQNRSSTTRCRVSVRMAELLQDATGRYYPQDPCNVDPNRDLDMSGRASCREWLSVASEENDRIVETDSTLSLTLALQTPATAQGFYCAAAILSVRPDLESEDATITTRVDYVIPVLVHIKNRPGECLIDLVDVQFEQAQTETGTQSTIRLQISNNGRSYNRLEASADLYRFEEGQWLTVREGIEIARMSIIPGSQLRLAAEGPANLLPGRYRLVGRLSIDRGAAITMERSVVIIPADGE